MFRLHRKCRACSNPNLIPVCDLGTQFPANNFVREDEEQQGAAPLCVLFCPNCTLAQLSVVVNPKLLYCTSYKYVTGSNPMLTEHFHKLWSAISEHTTAEHISVVEIGSNTGEFLLHCLNSGALWVRGVEPAPNLAEVANSRGVETVKCLFKSSDCPITESHPSAIVARHVFCHCDDWADFIHGLYLCANKDTIVVIEVPYVGDTLQRCELDQLYFEHLSYLSLTAMAALLKDTPFQMVDVRQYEIHGGAIAIFIKRKPCEPRPIVAEMIAREQFDVKDWKDFEATAAARLGALCLRVARDAANNKKVVGVGASAKSSVWIQACGFTKKDIRFICDNTPQKQGRFSPGTDIPIVPESHLTRENADVAILFSWNWESVMREKHKAWLDAGGSFINPHSL